MLAPSTSAARATNNNWTASELGERALWPAALRTAADIVLDSPWPMLLLWGPRQVMVFNNAYAELAGPHHPRAPGGTVPAMKPAPLAAAGAAFERALQGEHVHLERIALGVVREGGHEQLDCDLHLTPLDGADGRTAGVLCAVQRSPERALAPPPAGLRVLVVEDNLDSQYLVCEMLKAFGHEADGVGHGEGALELLAANDYQVLFSDVSLPGMSGVELARQAIAARPQLRVIFASGYGDALLKHLEFPYQSLQKPYEIDQLQAALAAVAASPGMVNGPPSV
jgi:CheY-like chemotaxis protein